MDPPEVSSASSAQSRILSSNSAMIDQVIKFAGVGAINTALAFIIIVLMKAVAGTGDLAANAMGYAVGLCASFLLNSKWTFRAEAGDQSRMATVVARFLAVFAVAYVINVTTVFALINSGVNSYAAHALGMPVYALSFFFGCRCYVFHSIP